MASYPAVVVAVVLVGFLLRYAVRSSSPSAEATSARRRHRNVASGQGGAAYPGARGARGGARAAVSPAMVASVRDMFPHIPTAAIEHDLGITGSVELTCENILSGTIYIPPAPAPAPVGDGGNGGGSSTSRRVTQSVHPQRLAPVPKDVDVSKEPPHKWSKNAGERQSLLTQRKHFLIRRAQQKLTAKEPPAGSDTDVTASDSTRTD